MINAATASIVVSSQTGKSPTDEGARRGELALSDFRMMFLVFFLTEQKVGKSTLKYKMLIIGT